MTKNPHHLEAISKDGKSSTERRRLPRLNFAGEQFRLQGQAYPNGKIFAVVDLSRQGMALRLIDPEDLRIFSVAAEIQGTLNIRREKFPIRARVRNVRPDVVGCEFENLESVTAEALKRFLDPDSLGQELRPIPASGQGTLWYHGPSGTDLLLWRGIDGQYHRLTLYVQGNYIQWESEPGVSTGRAEASQERSEIQGILRLETMLLAADAQPDPAKLTIAKNLLMSSNLPQDLKNWCVRKLEYHYAS
jgi:hypothetical protein